MKRLFFVFVIFLMLFSFGFAKQQVDVGDSSSFLNTSFFNIEVPDEVVVSEGGLVRVPVTLRVTSNGVLDFNLLDTNGLVFDKFMESALVEKEIVYPTEKFVAYDYRSVTDAKFVSDTKAVDVKSFSKKVVDIKDFKLVESSKDGWVESNAPDCSVVESVDEIDYCLVFDSYDYNDLKIVKKNVTLPVVVEKNVKRNVVAGQEILGWLDVVVPNEAGTYKYDVVYGDWVLDPVIVVEDFNVSVPDGNWFYSHAWNEGAVDYLSWSGRLEDVDFDGLDAFSLAYDSSESYIFSLAVYDGKLYAGSGTGGKVFVFDGSTWSESYDSSGSYIYSLAEYDGKLYAGSARGGKVFVFDGSTWSESYDSSETHIWSLAVYDGKLYAGSNPNGKVFVFDGSTWSESYDSSETYIFSLAVYDGKLYAGSGEGGKVFVFDGSSWSESYDSSEIYIWSLAVYDGKLYAGSGTGGKVFVFDGSTWSESYDSSQNRIYSLAVFDGKLYAGSNPSGKVFVFDGSTWSESYDSSETHIWSLAVFDGKLYAGSHPSGKVFVSNNNAHLMAYYPLSDNNGTHVLNIAPTTSNKYHAELMNDVDTDGSGLWDYNSTEFDGVNDYLQTDFNGTDQNVLSFSFWAKFDDIGTGSDTMYILDNSPGDRGFLIKKDINSALLHFQAYYNDVNLESIYVNISDTEWHHYYCEITGDRMYMVKDGSTTDIENHPSGDSIVASGETMAIGSSYDGASPIDGKIQDLKIWNKALSDSEILADYNAWTSAYYDSNVMDVNSEQVITGIKFNEGDIGNYGTEITETNPLYDENLVGLWHMNGNATDSSQYNRDYNADTSILDYDNGLWGTQSLNNGNYNIKINDADFIDLNSNFTINVWIKQITETFSSTKYIIGKYKMGEDLDEFILIIPAGSKQVSFLTSSNGSSFNQSITSDNNVLQLNKWVMVSVIKTPAKLKMYINGELIKSVDDTSSINNYDSQLQLYSSSINELEEVAIWDKALTDENVAYLFNTQASKVGLQYRTGISETELYNNNWSDTNYDSNTTISIPSAEQKTYSQAKVLFEPITEQFIPTSLPKLYNINFTSEQDTNAPTTIIDYNTGWQNVDGNITWTCFDSENNCKTFFYRTDSNVGQGINYGDWQTITWGDDFTFTGFVPIDGNIAIQYHSSDQVDNNESTTTIFSQKSTATPTTTFTYPATLALILDDNTTIVFDVNTFPTPIASATITYTSNVQEGTTSNPTCVATTEFFTSCNNDVTLIGDAGGDAQNTLVASVTDVVGNIGSSSRVVTARTGLEPKYRNAVESMIMISLLLLLVFGVLGVLLAGGLIELNTTTMVLAIFLAAMVATAVTLL